MKVEPDIFPDAADSGHRLRLLEDNADSVTDGSYFRHLTEPELDEVRQQHTGGAMAVEDLEEQLRELAAGLRGQIKKAKSAQKQLLNILRSGQQQETGRLYTINDYDANTVNIYDAAGTLIKSRAMKPDEVRAPTIYASIRATG